MPKRTRPPPPAAEMPKGQVFRRSNSAKKQKSDEKPKAVLKSSPSVKRAIPKKNDENGKKNVNVHSILKTNTKKDTAFQSKAPATSKGKERAAQRTNGSTERRATSTATPTKAAATTPAHIPKSFRIVVGSYERMLFGYHVKLSHNNEDDALAATFLPMFSFAAHTSCITSVATAGADSKWLATGAGDETIRVWDLRKRKEVGGLTGHGGTLHSLQFPMRTYLLSADSSGLINLYRTRDWALLKTLRGHTGRVNACQAHTSGKVALSVGQDGMLRMWDLMRGKGAGAVRLHLGESTVEEEDGDDDDDDKPKRRRGGKQEPLDVQWSPNGEQFVVLARTEVAVYKTNMQKTASVVVRHDDPKNKFGAVRWLTDEHILCGSEAGAVNVYRLAEGQLEGPVCTLIGHTNRVKAIRTTTVKPFGESSTALRIAVTASSDGKIRLYDLTDVVVGDTPNEVRQVSPFGTHDTGGARLTSLDVVGGAGVRTAAIDTAETDVEEDRDDDDDDGDEEDDLSASDDEDAPELDADEVQELNDLLDLIDEARAQGVDVEGMSDLDDLMSGEDDVDSDIDVELEEESEEEEEEE